MDQSKSEGSDLPSRDGGRTFTGQMVNISEAWKTRVPAQHSQIESGSIRNLLEA